MLIILFIIMVNLLYLTKVETFKTFLRKKIWFARKTNPGNKKICK